MTLATLLKKGQDFLKNSGIEEYNSDAAILFEYVTGMSHSSLLIHGNDEVDEAKANMFEELLNKRINHIPVQHLTGIQNFMGYDFIVNENVLIPRFDTEILVDKVNNYLKPGMSVLDVCTGSGCIIISLLLLNKDITGVATDISNKALEVANSNKLKHNINNLELVNTDLVQGLADKYETFDVIVSNPPYIETAVIATLSKEVKDHEPVLALDGGSDGLIFYRRLVNEGLCLLKSGGLLAVEIGYNQGEAVKDLFVGARLQDVAILKDYAGLDRVVIGYK